MTEKGIFGLFTRLSKLDGGSGKSITCCHLNQVIYLYFCTIGTLVTLPKFILNPILPATLTEWTMIAGIVLVSVTAQLLMNQGFFFCKGWEGGLYMTSEVIFTALVGIVFLSDPTSRQFWSGGFLILGSAVALNRINASAVQAEVSNKA